MQVNCRGFETLSLSRTKKSYNTYPVWTTPSILSYPFQDKGENRRHPCLKAIYWQFQQSKSRYSHCLCIIGVKRKFTYQVKSIVQANRLTRKLYTVLRTPAAQLTPYVQAIYVSTRGRFQQARWVICASLGYPLHLSTPSVCFPMFRL